MFRRLPTVLVVDIFPQEFFFFKPGDFLDNVVSFLAAMSSSRSDVVTQFVHLFVRPSVPFFSFSVLGVLSSPKEFQWCFKKELRVFEVYRMFQGSFNDVSSKF